MKLRTSVAPVLGFWLMLCGSACAGEADVVAATAECDAQRVCRFSVTVRHADSGWEHYANAWLVSSESGEVLVTRVLRHPHVNEQPFTRQLAGVKIPTGVERVRIRARDSVHAEGGAEALVELSGALE